VWVCVCVFVVCSCCGRRFAAFSHTHADTEGDRQIGRQADTHAHTQTDRQAGRQYVSKHRHTECSAQADARV
jgi:hypothetical protein